MDLKRNSNLLRQIGSLFFLPDLGQGEVFVMRLGMLSGVVGLSALLVTGCSSASNSVQPAPATNTVNTTVTNQTVGAVAANATSNSVSVNSTHNAVTIKNTIPAIPSSPNPSSQPVSSITVNPSTVNSRSANSSSVNSSSPAEFFIDVPNFYPVQVFEATTGSSATPIETTQEPGGLGVIPVMAPYPTGTTYTWQMTNQVLRIMFSSAGPVILTTPNASYSISATSLSGDGTSTLVQGTTNSQGEIPIPNDAGNVLQVQVGGQTIGKLTEPSAVWPGVLVGSMSYISLHTDGIMDPHEMAPTWLPTGPAPANGQHISATAAGNGYTYQVHLYWTDESYPVNAAGITAPPNTGLASIIGSFGESDYKYPSDPMNALAALTQRVPANLNQPVNLGTGITGWYSNQSGLANLVTWKEGEWSLQVSGGSKSADLDLARRMVAYLHTQLLPETHGVVSVVNAADGEHTTVDWASGDTLYTCTDYHFALDALHLAVSMKNYPTGAGLSY